MVSEDLLKAALETSVPLFIAKWRERTERERLDRGRACADVIGEHGDVIMFRGKKKGDTANAFNALAEALAILSFQPGGVKFLGLHFETKAVT